MENLTRNDSVQQDHVDDAVRFGNILLIYILPSIIFPGIALNAVSCFVFTSQDLKNFSSSIYIFALLVSDTGVLIGLFFVWLESIGYKVNQLNGVCQGLVFFTYVFSFLSVWYVVCITVENYITVCRPGYFMIMCTKRRATHVVLSFILLSLLLYLVTAVAAEVTPPLIAGDVGTCWLRVELLSLMHVMTYIDSLVTLLTPLIVISGMLIAIVISIIHKSKWKKCMTNLPTINTLELTPINNSAHNFLRTRAQIRVAKMLFALSASYLIMNAPSHVSRLYYLMRTQRPGTSEVTHSEGLIQLALQYLSYTQHASKFWIFVFISKNFMKTLKQAISGLLRCW